MASRTEIANAALGHLGQSRIADIDQHDPSAIAVRDAWNITRDKCLRLAPWSFAQADASLSKVVRPAVREWPYAWQLPADYIQLTKCNGIFSGVSDTPFTVRGPYLLTKADEAEIVYTFRVEQTELWDAIFVDAFSFALAEAIAPRLTSDSGEALAARKQRSGLDAMLATAIETRPQVIRASEGDQSGYHPRWVGGWPE